MLRRWLAKVALAAGVMALSSAAEAGPHGGVVTAGAAGIAQSGPVTTVTQTTGRAVINWQSFSTSPSETVDFVQPSTSSVTLNRVVGSERSVLEGTLDATGKVFLLNSSGVLMTRGAKVDTAGFVASSLGLSDQDFLAGKYAFQGTGPGAVANEGTLSAPGGQVVLLGQTVSNSGVITATRGTVALASGEKVTLSFDGGALAKVTVDQGTLDGLVQNRGAILADGGKVYLTARAAAAALSAQVSNTGLIQARTIGDLKGEIHLLAQGGETTVDGRLDASAPGGGDGGFVETSGDVVRIADGAAVTTASAAGRTGTWLIDPDGFTLGLDGDMTPEALGRALSGTSVDISSTNGGGADGDIHVRGPVRWSTDTTLTLTATRDVAVDAPITATGQGAGLALNAGRDIDVDDAVVLSGAGASLAMRYGGDYRIRTPASYAGAVLGADGVPVANSDTSGGTYGRITLSGAGASLEINGDRYTLIHSMAQLEALDGYDAATGTYLGGAASPSTVSGCYALADDLEAGGATRTASPIGSFQGTLAGLGHTVSHLTIASPAQDGVGLIGSATGATLRDIGLVGANVASGGQYVGALLGKGEDVTASGDYSSGRVTGSSIVGGLIGDLASGSASYCRSSATVTSTEAETSGSIHFPYPNFFTGGLVGWSGGDISHSDATGDVTSFNGYTGGLVGKFAGASIRLSYATGGVKETTLDPSDGGSAAGGLVGQSTGGVYDSFSTGDVSGYDQVGGLIGLDGSMGTSRSHDVVNSHATGDVTSYGWEDPSQFWSAGGLGTGGLIGAAYGVRITSSFATGAVTSRYDGVTPNISGGVGGLVGYLGQGTVTGSYASGDVALASGQLYGAGGLVGTASESDIASSFAHGDVAGGQGVGGLVGAAVNGGSITGSAAYGDVHGSSDVGGILGWSQGTATARPDGSVGSAVGETIGDVASYGDVTATGNGAGGIVGHGDYGAISNAAAWGDVRGRTGAGAIVGDGHDFSATGVQSAGHVTSDADLRAAFEDARTGQYASDALEDRVEAGAVAPGDSSGAAGAAGAPVRDHILLDPSMFSADITSVEVNGVDYSTRGEDDSKEK